MSSIVFSDDEPAPPRPQQIDTPVPASNDVGIKIHCATKTVNALEALEVTTLVTIKAPSSTTSSAYRPGVDLVAVLDCSGSMSGEKISLLRQTLVAAVEVLNPHDRLSIIKFETSPARLTPLQCMNESGKLAAREAILQLSADGGTNIKAALSMATAVVAQRRSRNPVCSILLLSDGQDGTRGLAYRELVQQARDAGASVSSVGYGADHDAGLLGAIAEMGSGEFTYIENLAQTRQTFGRFLGSLFSVTAQSVSLQLRPKAGATLAKVFADGTQRSLEDGSVQVEVGELFADESRDVLVEMSLPAQVGEVAEGLVSGVAYMEATLSWLEPGAEEANRRTGQPTTLWLRRHLEAEGAGVAAADSDVESAEVEAAAVVIEQQRNRLRAVDAIARAVRAGDAGQILQAQAILQEASQLVAASRTASLPLDRALIADLKDAANRLSSRSEYLSSGSAKVRHPPLTEACPYE